MSTPATGSAAADDGADSRPTSARAETTNRSTVAPRGGRTILPPPVPKLQLPEAFVQAGEGRVKTQPTPCLKPARPNRRVSQPALTRYLTCVTPGATTASS